MVITMSSRGDEREKVEGGYTGSRNYGCHTKCWRLLRTLHSCAFYVGPTGEEPGPSHSKLRSGRRLWLTRLLCLLCGRSIHPMAFEKSPMSDGPWSLCESRHREARVDTHQTFKNVSSDALMSTLPEAVSAQQQLLTSSWCASIFTVRLLASRS
jgi:hypothetical protein